MGVTGLNDKNSTNNSICPVSVLHLDSCQHYECTKNLLLVQVFI